MIAALSIHSFGQIVIFPWTYTKSKHPNSKNFGKLSQKLKKTLGKGALE